MDYVRNLVVVCAVGSVASAFASPRVGRGVRTLCVLLVALTAVSPITGFALQNGDWFEKKAVTEEGGGDAPSYGSAVLEQTAAVIASYVRDTLDEKYGVRNCAKISVLFDGVPDSLTLTEIQIFCGVRFDSYRDRQIEDELSGSLGCDVRIFSE